jgi:hypothetical protein
MLVWYFSLFAHLPVRRCVVLGVGIVFKWGTDKWITNSMQLSTTAKATGCSAAQEPPSILRDPKVHYRIHKSSPLVSILKQTNPVKTHHPIIPRSILILSIQVRFRLPVVSFPLAFPPITYTLYCLLHSCYMPHPSHHIQINKWRNQLHALAECSHLEFSLL